MQGRVVQPHYKEVSASDYDRRVGAALQKAGNGVSVLYVDPFRREVKAIHLGTRVNHKVSSGTVPDVLTETLDAPELEALLYARRGSMVFGVKDNWVVLPGNPGIALDEGEMLRTFRCEFDPARAPPHSWPGVEMFGYPIAGPVVLVRERRERAAGAAGKVRQLSVCTDTSPRDLDTVRSNLAWLDAGKVGGRVAELVRKFVVRSEWGMWFGGAAAGGITPLSPSPCCHARCPAGSAASGGAPGAEGEGDGEVEVEGASKPKAAKAKAKAKPKVCGQCLAAHYCSVACQQADWGAHKAACVPVPPPPRR